MVPKSYSLDKVYGSYECELCSLLTMRPTQREQTNRQLFDQVLGERLSLIEVDRGRCGVKV